MMFSQGPIAKLFVESRAISHDFGNGFDHLVVHTLSCTIEDDVFPKEYESICFGSLNDVNDDDLKRFEQGMECVDQGMPRGKCCKTKIPRRAMSEEH